MIGLVASCAKEEIIPAGNNGVVTKKSGSSDTNINVGKGDGKDGKGDNKDGDFDVYEEGDGDITDPENDLDFD